MARLDEKTFQAIATGAGPYPFATPVDFALVFPSDRLIVTVESTAASGDWVRAGYAHYIWERNNDHYLVNSYQVYLATSKICVIEPLQSAIIAFEPVSWLRDWTITIEASTL